jgi:anaerobic selenocysteine-containing dehydrogenase
MEVACHDNDVTARAAAVLPAACWAEVDGTVTSPIGLVQRLRPAFEPPGEARPRWRIVRDLANGLGRGSGASESPHGPPGPSTLDWTDVRALHADMVAKVPEFEGAEFGEDALPVQLRFAHSRG